MSGNKSPYLLVFEVGLGDIDECCQVGSIVSSDDGEDAVEDKLVFIVQVVILQ